MESEVTVNSMFCIQSVRSIRMHISIKLTWKEIKWINPLSSDCQCCEWTLYMDNVSSLKCPFPSLKKTIKSHTKVKEILKMNLIKDSKGGELESNWK